VAVVEGRLGQEQKRISDVVVALMYAADQDWSPVETDFARPRPDNDWSRQEAGEDLPARRELDMKSLYTVIGSTGL